MLDQGTLSVKDEYYRSILVQVKNAHAGKLAVVSLWVEHQNLAKQGLITIQSKIEKRKGHRFTMHYLSLTRLGVHLLKRY